MKVFIFKKETPVPWVCPRTRTILNTRNIKKQNISTTFNTILYIYIRTVYAMLQFNSSNLPISQFGQPETKVNQGRTDFNYTSPEACGTQESGNLANRIKIFFGWWKNTVLPFIFWIFAGYFQQQSLSRQFLSVKSSFLAKPFLCSYKALATMYHQGLSRKPCVPWNWKVPENGAANQEHVGKERKLDTDQRWIHLQTTLHLDFC